MARGTKQKTLIRRKRRRELNPKSEEEKERSANLFISISIDRSPSPSPSPSPVDLPSLLDLVFIGNLDSNVTEEELRQIFLQFGEIIYVKIPTSRGCGFVQFIARASAEEAIQRMQGTMIGQQAVHLSWGRSPTAKQDLPGVWSQQADPSQWSSTYYGYGQGYDAYGYGTTHDPSLYAYGAYPGFAQYPQQVEGSQEMASMAGAVPAVEQREEYDPLATPDVDKLNAAYLALPFMEVPFWAGPCGREPHHSHSKQAPMEAPILFVGL